MGCVHTHQRILVIEGWGNLICIQSVVEKIKEASQNPGKISRIVS
jgi:predicted proteasome-type protease